MKFAAAISVLVLGCSAAHADPLAVEIGRVGEVVSEAVGAPRPPRPGNVAPRSAWRNVRFTHLGTDIEGAFCKKFAVEFRAANLAEGETALVQVTLDHPLWVRPDGVSGTREVDYATLSGQHWNHTGYSLEEDWSLVPGPWTYTISQGGRVLASVTFDVTVAHPGQHMAAGACDPPSV